MTRRSRSALTSVILAGCGTGEVGKGAATGERESSAISDSTSGDSDVGPDSGSDSGAADSGADSAACIPSERPECVGDTGVCDGCPATTAERACDEPVAWLAPDRSGETRFPWDEPIDCTVRTHTATGDRILACADAAMVWSAPTTPGWYAAQWLGDLDLDGAGDLIVQRLDTASPTTAALVYAGRRLTSGTLEAQADAAGMTDFVPVAAAGDFDADGRDDYLVGILGPLYHGEPYPVVGIGVAPGGELAPGSDLAWAQPDAHWTVDGPFGPYWLGLGGPDSLAPVGYAADLTGDGLGEFIMSEISFDETGSASASRASVVAGAEMVRSGAVWDAANWRFHERWPAGGPQAVVHIRPVGDLDGDGAEELGVLDSPSGPAGSGWRMAVVSLAALTPCDYSVDDLMAGGLTVPGTAPLGFEPLLGGSDGYTFALHGARDLDGDGRADLVVGGSVAADDSAQPVLWFLYGGEAWLSAGGNLTGNVDRVEFAHTPHDYGPDWGYVPNFERIEAADIDANGIDDIVIGGSGGYRGDGPPPSWVTIIPGAPAGVRGVHSYTDQEFPVITGQQVDYLDPARGRGDLDGDGFEDLVLMGEVTDPYPSALDVWIFYGGAFP